MVGQSKVQKDSRSRSNTERKFDDGFITVTKVFAWGIAAISD